MAGIFRFTFGHWNIHEGADPFGLAVRKSLSFTTKLAFYKKLGFDGVQFHDDDAVPDWKFISSDLFCPVEKYDILKQMQGNLTPTIKY